MQASKQAVYIIAEAGVNHNGRLDYAHQLVEMAARAGANAIKFQTFNARKLALKTVDKASYQKTTTAHDESQLDMLLQLELPQSWHHELQVHAASCGIDFLSTAFDEDSLRFLQCLSLPLYKVPSGELTNAPLLWQFARIGAPLILSTGMATLSEVEAALAVVVHALNAPHEPQGFDEVWRYWSQSDARAKLQGHVTLLHCTSQYPTPWHEVNLRAMDTLAAAFGLAVGYSDHTQGIMMPIAAVARGARVIEKHVTLDKTLPGPDHNASIDASELTQMVADIRALEQALGSSLKVPQASEWDTRRIARQSLVAAREISAGASFVADDLTSARAGVGRLATEYWDLLGTVCDRDYRAGDVIQ
jgi:N-acetylneuraminate synthase